MGLNDFDFEVKVRSPIYPTEDKETLISCLSNIFPKTNWEIEGEEIVGETKYLTRFKSILEDMQIRDTARNYMKNRVLGEKCSFTLSKQATCNAKINFSEQEQPLGGVEVKIICKDIMMLIENLTEIEE
ncbi:MAG: RNA-binding domain-containing protein [Candidatus Thermoplasmatota archaeon]